MKLTKKIIGTLLLTFFISLNSINAQDGFIGEIRMFAGNFVPRGWAFCDGQILAISSNTALFSIIGTQYGGDGRTTFQLPDLRGRSAMGAGLGPGLTPRTQGQSLGSENVVLNNLNLPSHTHEALVTGGGATSSVLLSTDTAVRETPETGDVPAVANYGPGLSATKVKSFGPADNTVNGQTTTVTPPGVSIGLTGGGQGFNIVHPSTVVRYIICMYGIFPSRN